MKSKLFFDRIIVSSDDSPYFLDFWPIVSIAWNKYFGVRPTLALVTKKNMSDDFVRHLSKFGDVVVVPQFDSIPIANQAKLARFFVASMFDNEVCMIEDIDTIPLQSDYVISKTSQRMKDRILAVGKEIHPEIGKFPISNITAEGYLFKKIFNPNSVSYDQAINDLIGLRIFDHKEDLMNDPTSFSDESLIRALIHVRGMQSYVQDVSRDVDIRKNWVDRSWWAIDENKLTAGEYVCCNFLRPLSENFSYVRPIIDHILERPAAENNLLQHASDFDLEKVNWVDLVSKK